MFSLRWPPSATLRVRYEGWTWHDARTRASCSAALEAGYMRVSSRTPRRQDRQRVIAKALRIL